ncbi:sporulation protein [Bacillus sp. 7586-K]|uniref:Gas vesicle protein n=1 Tax=Metabacillus niabensis TaxID=324854 RepID=A0ABT9YXF6_9BACI|nr:sporulation membrane protein YtrI [Metabacillus niabensis]MDQ0224612.1 gas vesicle protein [Metabacillus niabensis]PAD68771.1 sporulation protein [Bacillus sp. 7586-K]
MRIPPYYQQPSWQRFFSGVAIGAIISWIVFLFIYGVLQEKHRTIIDKQKVTIQDLEKDKELYQEEYSKINKEAQKKITVQAINVHLVNGEKYLFKDFRIKKIEDDVKDNLADLIAKDMESVYANYKLIENIVENKTHKVDGKDYKLKMTKFMLYTTIYIEVEISLI